MSQTIIEYLKKSLNEEQFAATTGVNNHSLILAGAGSGKTRVLTYKIAYLIYEKQVKPERIMSVTFTNKASHEMKERLIQINRDFVELGFTNRYLSQYTDFKWVGTFHSLFLKFLKEEIENGNMGYTKNFGIYDDGEAKSVVKNILKESKYEALEVDAVRGHISRLKNQGITAKKYLNTVDTGEEHLAMIYDKYEKDLIRSNMIDFDDLLMLPYQIMKRNEEVLERRQKKFDYILVDEAQDTNWIQFELMRLLSTTAIISFIGDDYQSIYRRRGAQMENFLNVKQYWKNLETYRLQTNYRSKSHIVQAGHHLIKKNKKQYDKEAFAHRNETDHIVVIGSENEIEEAKNVIQLIKESVKNSKLTYNDIAILYRKNKLSGLLEQMAISQGVPYKIYGGVRFLERKEVKDILSYLKYINNQSDNVCLKRIINTPKRGIGAESLEKIEKYAEANNMTMFEVIKQIEFTNLDLSNKSKGGIMAFNQIITQLSKSVETCQPAELINQILELTKYKEYLLESEGEEIGREKIENVIELINLAVRFNPTIEENEQAA